MKRNAKSSGKYSDALDGASKRTIRHLRIYLKRHGHRPLDLGYEMLRGVAYKAGGGLVTVVIAWVATRR